jgi:hypothetical protein
VYFVDIQIRLQPKLKSEAKGGGPVTFSDENLNCEMAGKSHIESRDVLLPPARSTETASGDLS